MSFRRYAAERIAAYFAVLFLSLVAIFFMWRVIARRPPEPGGSDPRIQAAYEDYYDGNLVERLGEFLWGLVDRPSFYLENAHQHLLGDASVTLSVVGGAFVLMVLLGLPLGVLAARHKTVGATVRGFVYLAFGMFPIWLGLELSYYLGQRWGITPITGYCDFFNPSTDCGGAVQWAYHLLLPWVTLGLGFAAIYTRTVRALVSRADRVIAEASADVRSRVRAEMRRDTLIALSKRSARDIGVLIGATVFVELTFALPGLGLSVAQRDYPYAEAALATALVLALTIDLVVNLAGAAWIKAWRTR